MLLWLGPILKSKWTWIIIGVLLVTSFAWSYGKPYLDDWTSGRLKLQQEAAELQKKIDATQKDIDAKDQAIAALSKQIEVQKQRADAAVSKANAAEQRASVLASQITGLQSNIAALEAERKRQAPIQSLAEAKSALENLGYHPTLHTPPTR